MAKYISENQKISIKYNLMDIVYIVHDKEQLPYCVLEIVVCPSGVQYGVKYATDPISYHYEVELSDKPDELFKLN